MRMILGLHQAQSDVTFGILVVRMAKGEVCTTATLFNGLTANKMLDTINTERYSILCRKPPRRHFFRPMSPNEPSAEPHQPSVFYGAGGASGLNFQDRATKIIERRIWIPRKKRSCVGAI
jgi:hypothetical protein